MTASGVDFVRLCVCVPPALGAIELICVLGLSNHSVFCKYSYARDGYVCGVDLDYHRSRPPRDKPHTLSKGGPVQGQDQDQNQVRSMSLLVDSPHGSLGT